VPEEPTHRVANHDRLEALGRAMDARHAGPRHGRKTRRSPTKIVLISLATLIVVVVAAVAADYFYLNSLVTHVNVGGETKTYNNTENILLVGSTTRCGLKTQNKAYGLCAQGVTGVNSDVVMILHLDFGTNKISILSLPRDLFVPNARTTGANKIDAALYQGPTQLVAAVQDDFGVPINHYIELNFDTFASVVNVLGGINMYFPMQIFDAYSGLNIRHTGCIHLSGYRALQVVRARHLQIRMKGEGFAHKYWTQEALSDLARIRRDHEFLKVLGTAMKARGISNPITDQRLATAVAPYLTVDSGFSTSHMLSLVEHFHSVSVSGVPEMTVPVVLVETGSYLYKGYLYGDVEFPIEPSITSVIHQFLGLPSSINTVNGKALPKDSSVTVSVVNGTTVASEGHTVARNLGRYGFKISAVGAEAPWGKRTETVVYHRSNFGASLGAAQAVLRTLTGPAVMAIGHVVTGSVVTVVTGTDLGVLPVPSTHPLTTTTVKGRHHGASTTTTRPVTQITVVDPNAVRHDQLLSKPTAVTQALAPWDPRSCGPHGTPGP
jgi:LCP family protein required for cell wall assembly